jgi:NhaA family Na+:H+ antiporter
MQHPSEHLQIKQGFLPKKMREFMAMESSGGYVMIAFTLLALALANSPFSPTYQHIVHLPLSFPNAHATMPLGHVVQDFLMVLFFLIVGMELKREMAEGFLSNKDQILLPCIAAAGGMLIPSIIFYAINVNAPQDLHGWAIPSATDIAFALAILGLFAKNFPPAAKIFLLAIAIFDDLGAILIIALFYNTATPSILPLASAALCIGSLYLCNRLHIAHFLPYALLGITLIACFHYAGIHTTLAGVIVGLMLPLRSKDGKRATLSSYIHFLHPYVSFFVLPLFAFVSAGVDIRGIALNTVFSNIPLGIMLGLFAGKQIGIFGSTWLLITSKLVAMPEGTHWRHIYAVSVVAGIGFTMSLFIGMLAYHTPEQHELVKLGVLAGSLLSTLWGAVVLRTFAKK